MIVRDEAADIILMLLNLNLYVSGSLLGYASYNLPARIALQIIISAVNGPNHKHELDPPNTMNHRRERKRAR